MPTQTKYVAADHDEARLTYNSFGSNFSFDIIFVGGATTSWVDIGFITGGWHFQSTDDVDSAYVLLTVPDATPPSSSLPITLPIRAEVGGNPEEFSTKEDFLGRTLTTAVVNWNISTWGPAGTQHQSPDIKSLIEEVISDASWSPGNRIAIIVGYGVSNQGWVRVDSFTDGADYNPPALQITSDGLPSNTAPEITVTPTVSYGSLTRLGPNNTPATVTFTATDAEDTDTDDLTWEIRTAADGGGTLVSTGSCTHNASENASVANSDSGISEGSNTLYLRVGDGDTWSDDESFTVLCDQTAPTVGTITHSPNPVVET